MGWRSSTVGCAAHGAPWWGAAKHPGVCETPPREYYLRRCRPPTGPTSNTATPSLPLLGSCKTTTPSPPPSHLCAQAFQLESELMRAHDKDQQKAEEKAREKDAALQRAHEKEVVADCKMS